MSIPRISEGETSYDDGIPSIRAGKCLFVAIAHGPVREDSNMLLVFLDAAAAGAAVGHRHPLIVAKPQLSRCFD